MGALSELVGIDSGERTRLACWRMRFAFANFLGGSQSKYINEPKEKFVSAERRNQHSARVRSPEDCCDGRLSHLLAMPRLRDVLNPWLAGVIHQHKGQSVCVWSTELIHAWAFAIFGDFP